MNVPQLRFKGFEGEWLEESLNEFATKITQKNKGFKVKNVISNSAQKGLISQRDYFDKDIANSANIDSYYVIEEGDFVYNPRVSTKSPYGPVSIYKLKEKGIVSPLYLCFKTENISKDFLDWFFKSTHWHRYMYQNGDSGARHDRVSIKDAAFLSQPIKLPGIDEQIKIASFFKILEKRVERQHEKIEKLEQFKKGMMQKIFSQELRFKDEDGGEFPEWEKKKLNEISVPIKRTLKELDYQMPVLTISAGKGFLDQTDRFSQVIAGNSLEKYTLLREGELSYNRGASKAFPYGCIYSLQSYKEALVPNIYRSFRLLEGYQTDFYEQLFSTGYANKQLRQFVSSSARLDGLLNINQDDFFTLKVPVPSTKEQIRIGSYLTDLDAKIIKEKKKYYFLDKQKKGFMQNMFI